MNNVENIMKILRYIQLPAYVTAQLFLPLHLEGLNLRNEHMIYAAEAKSAAARPE